MIGDTLWLDTWEVANPQRLAAYLAGAGIPGVTVADCGCETLPQDYGCDPCSPPWLPATYTDPVSDPAPWYDPTIPESAEFLGMRIVDVATDAVTERRVFPSVSTGARFGPQRLRERTITLTFSLWGATCCGARFGLRWLAEMSRAFCDPCSTHRLVFASCCPPESTTDYSMFARFLERVAIVEGPTVVSRRGEGCCSTCAPIIEATLTLVVGWPWMLECPTTCLEPTVVPDAPTTCVTYADWAFGARRVCCSIPCPALVGEDAPIITITNPALSPVPYARIVATPQIPGGGSCPPASVDSGLDCPPDPGNRCARTTIGTIPAQSTLVVDAAREAATLTLPGGIEQDANRLLRGDNGPIEWPVAAGQQLCVCVEIPFCAPDGVQVGIDVVHRELVP